jgi:hypothetical protein
MEKQHHELQRVLKVACSQHECTEVELGAHRSVACSKNECVKAYGALFLRVDCMELNDANCHEQMAAHATKTPIAVARRVPHPCDGHSARAVYYCTGNDNATPSKGKKDEMQTRWSTETRAERQTCAERKLKLRRL